MRPGTILRVVKTHLCTLLIAGTCAASAANSELHLAGLALHQETGRNIYLGGIFLERQLAPTQELTQTGYPRRMEYRIVARRTSIRSLLGGMLLQSELATGRTPNEATTLFASDILAHIKGSLYAGDTFAVLWSRNNETVASLNGLEISRVSGGEIAQYLLSGWVGEQGPSTSFRESITAAEPEPSLLTTFEQSTFSPERAAEVASWIPDQPDQHSPVNTDSTGQEAALEMAAAHVSEDTKATELATPTAETGTDSQEFTLMPTALLTIDTSAKAANEPLLKQPTPKFPVQEIRPKPNPEPNPVQGTQVASLAPESGLSSAAEPAAIDALEITDYSQRLAAFNARLIQRVYGEIRYPRQAVRRNLEGRLELDVTLQANGQLAGITVAHSSGHHILDTAAINAAEKALSTTDPSELDAVAVAEYGGDSGKLVIPVPVQFLLTN